MKVLSSKGKFVGTGLYNPHSKITIRIFSTNANDRIDDAECIKLIQKLAKQGKESAEIYRQQGREDLYEQESGQVAVLEEFLPKQLDEAELTEALKAIIAEVGASSAKDMGKVMGTAT